MSALKPLAIYVHWPWCKAKCPYCDFNSHAGLVQEEPYVEGLISELQGWRTERNFKGHMIAPYSPATHRIKSVFFGGGTPSLMAPANIAKVLENCHALGIMDATTEVTVECNPTSFDDSREATQFFADLKAAGINRISVGIQGLKPEWLTFLGRTHRVEDALATLDAAQSVFDNVNADVIYGLPNQDVQAWVEQLESLAQRGLSHISAYQLTIEQNTRFYMDVKRGAWEPIPADLEADFFDATRATLAAAGYENYEISNFARPGKACRHNVHVWKYGEYLGIGAGAHGRIDSIDGTRLATQVTRQPDGYLRRMKDLSEPLSQIIPLDGPETVQEALFSGLRLAVGCDVESVLKRTGEAAYKVGISDRETTRLVDAGFIEWRGTHLRLTEQGWPRLNSVLTRLLTTLPKAVEETSTPSSSASDVYSSHVTVSIE